MKRGGAQPRSDLPSTFDTPTFNEATCDTVKVTRTASLINFIAGMKGETSDGKIIAKLSDCGLKIHNWLSALLEYFTYQK